ncbi:CrcB protein [Paenibacillus darwinianus]|uniref:Fluoride-specific ion channel FluC n=1 Tax=Paenibacillus darwinianus TaxID=1380763 RepID=A0A9W5W7M5_9BACL|nr:CrcB protein [Paenibacillus darwinianus]EXX88298.1 CrcB protein [Paenibacillus darwinianus]EXX89861.1 CrcB protein [Paenibacillus darwinianus]
MKLFAGVAAGGAIGAVARYGIGLWLNPGQMPAFPLGTLAANVLGCFLLGALLSYASVRGMPPFWKETVGTGMIGSFTTFSAFGMETFGLLRSGYAALALLYAALSVALGYAAARAGMTIGRSARKGGRSR